MWPQGREGEVALPYSKECRLQIILVVSKEILPGPINGPPNLVYTYVQCLYSYVLPLPAILHSLSTPAKTYSYGMIVAKWLIECWYKDQYQSTTDDITSDTTNVRTHTLHALHIVLK